MRRWFLYFVVAWLAFGIGLSIAAEFCQQVLLNVSQSEQIETSRSYGNFRADLKRNNFQNLPENQSSDQKKVTFTCNEKILSTVLNDSRKNKDFNGDFLNYLDERRDVSDCHDILLVEESVDLNGDGIKEFIVRGKDSFLCGGTGNCTMWIYKKSGNGYKKLLKTGGESLIVKRILTNGYKDIFVRDHYSAYSSYQATFKFDRKKYYESRCLFVDDSIPVNKFITTCAEETARIEKESSLNIYESSN